MRHDMESCDQDGEDQDKTWLDGPVASVKVKLSGSYHLVIGWCMCCINNGGDGMECTRQRYNLGPFISLVIGV